MPARLQGIVRAAAADSAQLQTALWENAEEASRAGAERMGVIFDRPDKAAFMARLAGLKREFMDDPELAGVMAQVDAM
jgi:TRAP-type C4-dicarboxylate transport system substrate-binding protein